MVATTQAGTSRMLPVCELIHRVVPRTRVIA
jgi:hypothetical protein